jgi:hypothetical protein
MTTSTVDLVVLKVGVAYDFEGGHDELRRALPRPDRGRPRHSVTVSPRFQGFVAM